MLFSEKKEWERRICPKCGSPYYRSAYRKDGGVLCSMQCRRALTARQVKNMRTAYENKWAGIVYFARFYKLPPVTIWRILTRRRYKDVK